MERVRGSRPSREYYRTRLTRPPRPPPPSPVLPADDLWGVLLLGNYLRVLLKISLDIGIVSTDVILVPLMCREKTNEQQVNKFRTKL